MKLALYILGFAFILGCNNSNQKKNDIDLISETYQANCIERILKKDGDLGEIRNHATEKISLSQAINNYINELKSLDFSNCPQNFTSAFTRHIAAWKAITKVTDNHSSQRGELHDIFERLQKSQDSTEFKSLLKVVWDTWHEVEESAH